jgi:ribonuclease P/MRP protein subunit RPP1
MLILNRVTIEVNATNDFDLIGSTQSKKFEPYDLVAVMPTSDEAFAAACAREDLDLIAIDASSRIQFRPKPQHVDQAIARGVYFELRYSGALQSDTCRQYFIANATVFIRACRGRGLIASSGGKEMYQVRSAHDLANLMCLCGAKGMERALEFVSSNPKHIVERANERRLQKAAKESTAAENESGGNIGSIKKYRIR